MRNFLSKFFLVAFIFVFAMPTSLLAQNWTPPTQPAVGGNTPSPINVSQFSQDKRGRLTIDGEGADTTQAGFTSRTSSNLRGTTVVNTSDMPGASPGLDMFISWVKSYFMNNVTVGQQGLVGPEVKLNGQFYYKPLNSNGSLTTDQPATNKVLKAADASGKITWGTAIPDGVNTGDTLIWDSTCNCWVTGPGGGNGTTTPSGLPTGTQGQTLWYSAPNVLQATDQVFHDNYQGFARTSINNPLIHINGSTQVKVGILDQGSTAVLSNTTKIRGMGGVDIGEPSANGPVNIISPQINLGTPGTPSSDYQTVEVKSGNVNFAAADDGGYQTVTFESDAVKFRNINMTPGTGFLPYALDDEGRFGWNQNLKYELNQGGVFPFPMGQLTLHNPAGGLAVLQNQGMSHLFGDVVVSPAGDVYLQGVGSAFLNQMGTGVIKPLCYVTTTGKIVTCVDNPLEDTGGVIGFDPNPNGIELPTDFEILRTHEDSPGSYTFQANQTVTVEWCGGGGGGGGGGLGGDTSVGGGGGGGGSAGNCSTQQLDVTAGDVLSWDIGAGGTKGLGGWWRQDLISPSANFNQNRVPAAGGPGAPTLIYFSDDGAAPTQVGQMQTGGTGGQPGMGDNTSGGTYNPSTGGFNGGAGANGGLASWHDGNPGYSEANPLSNQGGHGGDGDSPAGSIGTWLVPSAGGKGGIYGALVAPDGGIGGITQVWSYGDYSNRWGGDGQNGNPGHGAGGGGGGYGETVNFPHQLVGNPPNGPGDYSERRARDGGEGGSGYVRISGLYNSGGATGVDYDEPNANGYTLNPGSIPVAADTVDIEIWGAGGGGGGIQTGIWPFTWQVQRLGGGGGAGGYLKLENVPRSLLIPSGMGSQDLTLVVGASGTGGESSGNSTSGTAGGLSRIVRGDGVILVSVNGGGAGVVDDTSGGAPYPAGGAGGGFTIHPSISASSADIIQQSQGPNGSAGTATTSNNNGGQGWLGVGAGGEGAQGSSYGGGSMEAASGGNGRVKISW